MSAKGSKKIGFFQKLFCPHPPSNRRVKEAKKGPTSKPAADLPADLPLLEGETTSETQPSSLEPPRPDPKTGQSKSRVQAASRAMANSSTLAALVIGRPSTQVAKSSTQTTTTKSSTQPGRVAKPTTQTGEPAKGSNPICPSIKGQTRTGSESGRRALPAKPGSTSGSRVRTGKAASGGTRPSRRHRTSAAAKRSQRRRKKRPSTADVKVDTSRPLEYPTTPEMILAYHKAKSFLNKTEEWVIMSLNEYECMVDSVEVIRTMAKHSQFFEVEPEELCEEFFEYVEDVPSYDEVINPDIWQEFRYEKYNW